MEQKQETTKKEKVSPSSLSGWIHICVGILLISLSIVAAVGKGGLGQLLTYGFAFVFGALYPFVLVLLVVLGLRFIIARSFFPIKKNASLSVGLSLVAIAVIAFSSYSLFASQDNGLAFSSMNTFYFDRMLSFAHDPFNITSYEALGGLGGGYLGIFFLCVLGSLWSIVGDIIFFSLILAVGLFFVLFRPIVETVDFMKKRREEKVKYQSEFQPKKDKSTPYLDRRLADEPTKKAETVTDEENFVPSKKVTAPFSSSWQHGETVESSDFVSADTSFEEEEEEEPEAKEEPVTVDSDNFHQAAELETAHPVTKEVSPKASYSNTPIQADYSGNITGLEDEEISFVSSDPVSKLSDNGASNSQTKTPVVQESVTTKNSVSSKEEVASKSSGSNNVNPLESVPKKAKVVVEAQEFSVAGQQTKAPVEEEEEEPEEELSEEEKEQQIANAYFAKRQQEQATEILAKQKEKEAKMAELMRFVSDTPKTYSYALPNDSMLSEIDDSAKVEKNKASAQEKAAVINKVLEDYGVKAKATSFTIGASVTRFNIETERGEKADKIASLTSEFQRALNGDMSVRVETVVEGRSTSGVEVGNAAPMAVAFKDMFAEIELNTSDPLLLPIGKDISGNIVTFPLNKMPHMLVAGTTGSGKSVLVHSMIMAMIMRTYPSQLKLILIDPKQVEFIRYSECSHLFCPVISKPESAILALKKLCDEMDRRFSVLSKYRCANLEDYNDLRKGQETVLEAMPYLVCIIDEFADLMQTGGKEVTQYVTRIAQKARACGIHLIIATQRPSKDNVPMIIKANVPSRIGLSCSSQIDSRVILDENGAETLLGKGDLLFKCPGKKALIRAQSPFISNHDINAVLDYVKQQAGDPVYDPNFLDLDVEQPVEEENVNPEGDLYSDIRDFVSGTGITSKTTIMRQFQLSSLKADQFLSRLAAEGVIMLGANGKYVLGPTAQMGAYH